MFGLILDRARRSDPAGEPFARALEKERIRAAEVFAAIRCVAVAVWLALAAAVAFTTGIAAWRVQLPFLAVFCAAAALAFALRRVPAVRPLLPSLLPAFDVPMVGLIMWHVAGASRFPQQTVPLCACAYMLAIVATLSTLERVWILATAAVSAASLVVLGTRAGIARPELLASLFMIAMAGATVAAFASWVRRAVRAMARDQAQRNRLLRHFSPAVAEQIARRPIAPPEEREATILFSDIRNFTALSERLGPRRTVEMLDQYFEVMVESVFRHGGTLDKYVGDGLLAYFGAPIGHPNHAERGVECALEMLASLDALNRRFAQAGEPTLQIGIGVHTGRAMVGEIGSSRRREFTIVGDAVNVASRIEGLTRTHGPLLVSETVFERVRALYAWRAHAPSAVRGKSNPISTWRPLRRIAGARRYPVEGWLTTSAVLESIEK